MSTATHATLGGLTLVAGVYDAGGATLGLTGTLTLDGQNDPNSVWIFQATSDLVTASSSTVRMINGGDACNVFWQVTSSATLGSGSTMVGTIMALHRSRWPTVWSSEGRALARNGDVTLINDQITGPGCAAPAPTPTPAPSATPTSGATTAPRATPPATDALAGSDTLQPRWTPAFAFVSILVVALVLIAKRHRIRNR